MSFTIDDVRETFRGDIGSLIERIRRSSALLAAIPEPPPANGFEQLVDACHTIGGTAALVSATRLSEGARAIEQHAAVGLDALAQAAQWITRARDAARLCIGTEENLAALLSAELEKDTAEATRCLAALQQRLSPTEAQSPEDELASVFKDELRAATLSLRQSLSAIQQDPSDAEPWRQAERIYHTLKGAAASVGIAEVAKRAEVLQKRLARALAEGEEGAIRVLDQIVAPTVEMIEKAGLVNEALLFRAAFFSTGRGPEAPSSALGYYREEAESTCVSALDLVAQLERSGTRSSPVVAELERLFHRLKGSALVAGDRVAADRAAEMQVLCKHMNDRTASSLRAGVAALLAHLRGEHEKPRPALRHAEPESIVEQSHPAVVATGPVRESINLLPERELWEAFNEECQDLLEQIEKAVLELEPSDQPKRQIASLVRLFHTLKGAASTIGLAPVGRSLHRVEDLLEDLSRKPVLPPLKGVAAFLLTVPAMVRRALRQAAEGYVETDPSALEAQIAKIWGHGPSQSSGAAPLARSNGRSTEDNSVSHAKSGEKADERVFIRVTRERLDALMNLAGELVVSRSRLFGRVARLKTLQQDLSQSRRRLTDAVDRFRADNEFSLLGKARAGALLPRDPGPAVPAEKPGKTSEIEDSALAGFSDLEIDRYDDVNILSRTLAEITDDVAETSADLFRELASFTEDSDALGGIVGKIQGEVTRARMVPMDLLFSRLRLPVRDAAEKEGREARVDVVGEEVNIDKTIADALFSPMLHLVRNSVAHGIEAPADRESKGKPREGVVTLSAREESGRIVIEVSDDGAGLDLAALKARGVEQGLLRADVPLDDPAIKELVFASGLSTRRVANTVSGRGVGGDVVKRAVERMNGSVRVSTEQGKGTKLTITLPLTLAITRALLVRVGRRSFAIPMHFAERILAGSDTQASGLGRSAQVRVQDVYLPLVRLDAVTAPQGAPLGQADTQASKAAPMVVLSVGNNRMCLSVDQVLDQEEIVVKPLGDLLQGHPLFAGVTVRGSGDLMLILDVPGLMETCSPERKSAQRSALAAATQAAPQTNTAVAPAAPAAQAPKPANAKKAPAPAPPASPTAPLVPAQPPAQRPALRVLFVDDSLSVRKVAERALMAIGAEVTLAVDGLDALEKMRLGQFDIVMTDLEMPKMHGYDLIRELRFVPAYKTVPIVVISSRSTPKHVERARELGANDYLTKPFTTEVLGATLRRHVASASDKGVS